MCRSVKEPLGFNTLYLKGKIKCESWETLACGLCEVLWGAAGEWEPLDGKLTEWSFSRFGSRHYSKRLTALLTIHEERRPLLEPLWVTLGSHEELHSKLIVIITQSSIHQQSIPEASRCVGLKPAGECHWRSCSSSDLVLRHHCIRSPLFKYTSNNMHLSVIYIHFIYMENLQ